MPEAASRILVFRLGSIGDFVIALPCFHLLRSRFPDAEIVLLTNEPANDRIVPAESVLQGTGLVDRYVKYSSATRDVKKLGLVRREIRALAPDMLIYLASSRGLSSTYRDYLFFRWCGIRRVVGVPLTLGQVALRPLGPGSDLVEPEARRLGRQLAALGCIDFLSERSWDLHLSASEIGEAARLFDESFPEAFSGENRRVLGLSVGTKQPINDWGNDNWRAVLQGLRRLDFGLVLVGGPEDWQRSQDLADNWPGPVLNLCGRVSPRTSAAVLRHVHLFLCHDSGPMHAAAAVGTSCVAVFSRRNPPGKWFPFGSANKVLYPTSKSGTIEAIRPRQVIAAVVEALETNQAPAPYDRSKHFDRSDVRH